jgi:hypothetical protein
MPNDVLYLTIGGLILLSILVTHPNPWVQLSLSVSTPLLIAGSLILRFLGQRRTQSVESELEQIRKNLQTLNQDKELRKL